MGRNRGPAGIIYVSTLNVKGDIFMDIRHSSANSTEDAPILYLRNAMIVRDSAHAPSEMTPEGRAWSYTIFASIGAAILGSVFGMLMH